jgi:uncharacterized membrane protein
MYEGFWLIFQRIAASLLILLVGISLNLRYESAKKTSSGLLQKILKRGLSLAFIAGIITIATWIYPNKGFIIFGIIHFIALAVLLGYFFLRFFYLNLLFGFATIFIGLWMESISTTSNLFFWLGLPSVGFYSLDYFPIFPWFGLVLIGIFLGKCFYPNNKRKLNLRFPQSKIVYILTWMGRNSLLLYLIHQPVLIVMMHILIFIN